MDKNTFKFVVKDVILNFTVLPFGIRPQGALAIMIFIFP